MRLQGAATWLPLVPTTVTVVDWLPRFERLLVGYPAHVGAALPFRIAVRPENLNLAVVGDYRIYI